MAKIRNLEVAGYADYPGPGLLSVKKYGAKGNNSDDDRDAINNAISDAFSKGIGGVFFPPGIYRVSNTITGSIGVSLYGVPKQSFISINHATNDTIVFSNGPNDQNYTYIKDLVFTAAVFNQGVTINNASGTIRLIIDNCVFNGGGSPWNGGGNFLWMQTTNPSFVTVRNCILRTASNNQLVIMSSTNGFLNFHNNYCIMGDGFGSNLLTLGLGRAIIADNYFDLTERTSGGAGASCIGIFFFIGQTAFPQAIHGNVFFMNGGPQTYALSGNQGGWFVSTGNTYTGSVTRTNTQFLDIRSKTDLIEVDYGSTGGTTMTIPDNVESFSASFSSTAPTLTMPVKIFAGQEITVTIRNAGAGAWSGIGMTNLNGPLISTTVSGGQAVTFKAKVMTTRANGSTFAWTMIGQYSIAFTTT